MKAILVVLGMLAAPALGYAGQQPPPRHEPARSPESGGHHHGARSQPDAPPAAPAMPGLSAAQVLSGPLPMFPQPASPFDAAPSTYVPHKGLSPFLRPRRSIVIGGFAFGGDASPEMPSALSPIETPAIEMPAAAPQSPNPQPPDAQPPVAPPDTPASVAPPNTAPVTLYVIPGCYAGDKPPADGMLPSGCDVANLRIVRIR